MTRCLLWNGWRRHDEDVAVVGVMDCRVDRSATYGLQEVTPRSTFGVCFFGNNEQFFRLRADFVENFHSHQRSGFETRKLQTEGTQLQVDADNEDRDGNL